jgi:signal transduction histidine kinase/ActR/RegA family two-component response regulator
VVQLAHRLGYSQVEILLVEGESLVQRAYFGVKPPWDRLLLTKGIVGRVAGTGIAALVMDVNQDPDYRQCYTGTVSELAVPIFHGTVVVGVINIESQVAGQLSKQDRDFVEVLAGQISIALESAILYERVRKHAEELEHKVAQRTAELVELNELSHEIGYTLSYEELLRLLISHLRNAVQSELVAGGLFVEGKHILVVDADRSITPLVLDELKSDYLTLLSADERYIDKKENVIIETTTQAGSNGNDTSIERLTSLIHAPIMSTGDLVGILVAGNENGNEFGSEQERLLDTFANHASNAIQNMAAKLAAEQKRLESLVEHLPVGVLLLDSDYRLLIANTLGRMMLSALNEGEELGQISHLGSKGIEDLIAEHNNNSPIDIALDGSTHRIYEAQARPVLRDKHQWVVTLREVTQERENQARIHMQDRLATVGQLAAGIAHDFNNIMAAILVYADLLSQEPNLPPISRDRISIIQQQVHRSASLIRQILDFSRQSVMEQSPLALLPFMKEFEKMLRRVMPEIIELDLSYTGENYVVRADPTRLQQVFMNLAVNARDAMPDGGLLSFELDRFLLRPGEPPPISDMVPGEWVRIAVKDTGNGISPENLQHMFEPFYTTKPAGEGTGLGLAQVYGIIKQHDGHIRIQSELGKGTNFTIYIPPLPTSLEDGDILEPQTRFDGVGVTALVVEDDRATLEALRALLDAHNYNVLTALNGVEALEQIDDTQEVISLVVSDVVMPEMGGVDLYRVLQKRWPNIKILFVTGHPLEGENQALLERGDVHWLQKPFSVREFSYAVNNLMGDEKVVV